MRSSILCRNKVAYNALHDVVGVAVRRLKGIAFVRI